MASVPQYNNQFAFGGGVLTTIRTDVTVPTPIQFGTIQDVSVDLSVDLKELYGQGKFAIALGPGKNKVEIKAKVAAIRGRVYNDLFFGSMVTTTGTTQFTNSEADSVPASSTYTVTVANAATFIEDCGVVYSTTGLPLTCVASAPVAGQYAVSSVGVYTFAAGDASAAVLISYTWTKATNSGLFIPISNQIMGAGPAFSMVLNDSFDTRAQTLVLNSCKASKLSLPRKQDDFMITEIDFMCCADQSGNIGSLTTSIY